MTLNNVSKNKHGLKSYNEDIACIITLYNFSQKINFFISVYCGIKFKRGKFGIVYDFPAEERYLDYTLFDMAVLKCMKPPYCLGNVEKEKNINERSKHG